MLEIAIFKSLEELFEVRDEYNELVLSDESGVGVFYTYEWLNIFSSLYISSRFQLYFIAVLQNKKIVSIVPFVYEKKPIKKLGLRRLAIIGQDIQHLPNFMPFMAVKKCEEAEKSQIIRKTTEFLLGKDIVKWDLLDVKYCENATALMELLEQLDGQMQVSNMKSIVANLSEFPGFISKKYYMNSKRLERKIYKEHPNVNIVVKNIIETEELVQISLLHSKRQEALIKDRSTSRLSYFGNIDSRRVIENVLTRSEMGKNGVHALLKIGDKIIAFVIGFRNGDTYFPYIMSFDDEFESYSPCALLFNRLYEGGEQMLNYSKVNLMPGENSFKRRYSSKIDELYDCRITNRRSYLLRLINMISSIK